MVLRLGIFVKHSVHAMSEQGQRKRRKTSKFGFSFRPDLARKCSRSYAPLPRVLGACLGQVCDQARADAVGYRPAQRYLRLLHPACPVNHNPLRCNIWARVSGSTVALMFRASSSAESA